MGERKDWEFISQKEWEREVQNFRTIYCKFIRWDIFEKEDGTKVFIISLASPEHRIITQSALSDEEALRQLRDALSQLLAEPQQEKRDVMFAWVSFESVLFFAYLYNQLCRFIEKVETSPFRAGGEDKNNI